jgi:hypothetical protein
MQCACAVLSSVACPTVQYSSTLSHKGHDFRKKVLDIKRVLIFSATLSATFFVLRRNERKMIKMCIGIHVRHPLFLPDLNES